MIKEKVSWSPRAEVISLMRDEEAMLTGSFCFFLSGKPWPPARFCRLSYIIPQQTSSAGP